MTLVLLQSACSLWPRGNPEPAQPQALATEADGTLVWRYPGQDPGVVVTETAPRPDAEDRANTTAIRRPETTKPEALSAMTASGGNDAAASPIAAPETPAFDASWWVCLSSWQQAAAAFAARERAQAAGLVPIIRRHRTDQQTLYRVLVGPFPDRAQAQQWRARDLVRRLSPQAWLLPPSAPH